MFCKNICTAYRAKEGHRGSYYKNGYKRCTDCEVFIEWNGLRSPCRGRLRIKTHDAKVRRKSKANPESAA